MDDIIDFVITWVDESDPKWQKEFEYWSAKESRCINTDACRYRDWGTLRYWFRGVEKFAPWVNKIYFVTYGHLPQWLDTDNPKLVVVRHEDFIPSEYLPTFNSNVIEFFFHKIKGLSEKFVYFNDDMFLIGPVSSNRFFKKDQPCDMAVMNHLSSGMFGCSLFLAVDLINRSIKSKNIVVMRHLWKWFNPLYSKYIVNNFVYILNPTFPGFIINHLPQGYLKCSFSEVWNCCSADLIRTSKNKYRAYSDVAFWLVRYWQLVHGRFTPYNIFKDGKLYHLSEDDIDEVVECLLHQKKRLVCLNDDANNGYEVCKGKLLKAFDTILPYKSKFEI